MLILHLITGLQLGGAESQLAQLVLSSDKRCFRHVVVSLLEGGAVASGLEADGIDVRSLRMKRGIPSAVGALRLIRLLRQLNPDVLHCWLYHACLMGTVCARVAGQPSVIWGLRSANPGLGEYPWHTRAVVRLCAKFSPTADCIVVNSEKNRIVHLELGYAPSRMKTIENGVDSQRFCPNPRVRMAIRDELGVAPDSVLVGMFAGFRPQKDHKTFLHAARLVRERHRRVRFLLAGEGISSHNTALLHLLHQNNLQQVAYLLGPRSDIERLTAALDIACLSSWSESFPNAIAEAMACEVPCVVTDAGDAAHIVGDTGTVVPSRNPEALAEACSSLLEVGEQRRKELGARARKRIEENFAVGKSSRSYENLYEEMLGVPRDRARVRIA